MEPIFNHLNPAVIKQMLLLMKKDEFIKCALYFKKQAMSLPLGNKRTMYVNLYGWCVAHYKKKKPTRK